VETHEGDANMMVVVASLTGTMHVATLSHGLDGKRTLCGVLVGDVWRRLPGMVWASYPPRRCGNCDHLGPNARLMP
jgi:hypothetical protein